MKFSKLFILIALSVLIQSCHQPQQEKDIIDSSKLLTEVDSLSIDGFRIHDDEVDKIIEKCNHTIMMAQAIGDSETELHCYVKLLEILGNVEEYKDAIEVGDNARELAIELDDTKSLAQIHKLVAINYYHLASFTQAFENLEKALQLYTELGDTLSVMDVLNSQGNVYFTYNDFNKAFTYYEQNLELSKVRNDKVRIAKALNNIALIYSYRTYDENLSEDSVKTLSDKAVEYIKSALIIVEDTDELLLKAEILLNLSDEYRNNGDFKNALLTIKDAITISKNISDRVYIWSNASYANILIDMDSLTQAKEILLSVSKLSEENELSESLVNIHFLLSDIYTKEEDYKNALFHRVKESEISESIYSMEQKNQIDAIRFASEIEAREKQGQIDGQNRLYRIYIGIMVFILLSLTVLYLYSNLRQRSKNIEYENKLLNERLEARNRELSTRIMALIQRNEVEKEMVLKLNKLKLKLKKENQIEVQDIIRSLSFKQNDQLWKEFEIRFESIHKEFFIKLANSYPELTTNERRLCAFLYLDMSSKDISAITGQSIRALNVARTRLRKRFNLTNDTQSISGFLNSM